MAPYFNAIALVALTSLSVITSAANPRILPGNFTRKEHQQITDGFSDAILLAEYAIRPLIQGTPHYDTRIFNKYFHAFQLPAVRDVFSIVLGGIPNGRGSYCPDGAPFLGTIDILRDYERTDGADIWVCVHRGDLAGMRDWHTNSPEMILCNRIFDEGGLSKSYKGGPQAVTCNDLGSRTGYDMEFFGSILLHEYLHYKRAYMPPLQTNIDDYAWGAFRSQQLRRNSDTWRESLYNSDNYVYYALETLWTELCGRHFGDPDYSPPSTSPQKPGRRKL